MVVEYNWRSTWTCQLRELRDEPLGGLCDERIDLEGRESTINTPPHLSQHPNRIHEQGQFWFEGGMNQLRRDTTWY